MTKAVFVDIILKYDLNVKPKVMFNCPFQITRMSFEKAWKLLWSRIEMTTER